MLQNFQNRIQGRRRMILEGAIVVIIVLGVVVIGGNILSQVAPSGFQRPSQMAFQTPVSMSATAVPPPPASPQTPFATRTFTFAMMSGDCTKDREIDPTATAYAKVGGKFIISAIMNFSFYGSLRKYKMTGVKEEGTIKVSPDELKAGSIGIFCRSTLTGVYPVYVLVGYK